MARKSRRTPITSETYDAKPSFQERCRAGAYVRISVDKGESDTIHTQMTMLHDYIRTSSDLVLEDTYIDNGYTGTTFDRPEFTRMMEDIRSGRIHCIVVKDLSRFGRSFLETGYYIETILPKLNARLIAITDSFDSAREEDVHNIAVPIKNLVNEMYAKDFSRKVTAYNDLHRQNGDVKLLRAVYGYTIDRERNQYVENPETAPVVRMIFRWYSMGYKRSVIAERLNDLGISTPFDYCERQKTNAVLPEKMKWSGARVGDILKNPVYIGELRWGRRRKTLYLNVPEHKTPQEEWTICYDMHAPLISEMDFHKVQNMQKQRSQMFKRGKEFANRREYVPTMQGKVFCAKCGEPMRFIGYEEGRHGGYYRCSCVTGRKECRKVHADFLNLFVSDQIHIQIKALCDQKRIIDRLHEALLEGKQSTAVQRKVQYCLLRVHDVEKKIAKLYEDFADGTVSEEEYDLIKRKYVTERENASAEYERAKKEENQFLAKVEQCAAFEKEMESVLSRGALPLELVQELVGKIVLHPDDSIEISLNCADTIRDIMELSMGDSQ